jgi:transcriptional regulator with XRE-family HTH domain
MVRENLKDFRLKMRKSQGSMAEEIGYSRQMYAQVENGERDGTLDFWNALQEKYKVADSDMWLLMKKTEKRG